ncbi:MAG: hypothetical protein OHK0017_09420 [Patescibacteria group bacterium]
MPKIVQQHIDSETKVFLIQNSEIENHLRKNIFEQLGFKGNYKQTIYLPESNELYIGVSYKSASKTYDPFSRVNYFELGVTLTKNLPKKINQISIEKFGDNSNLKDLFDFVLGAFQAAWTFDKYLNSQKSNRKEFNLVFGSELGVATDQNFVNSIEVYNRGLTLTRTIIDETPEELNPQSIVDIIKNELGSNSRMTLKFLDAEKMSQMGMNSILAVGRASRYQPVLVHAVLKPLNDVKRKICLIGKGLTYDSGGMDIKTEGHMKTMKCDMGGAATMFGTIKILSELQLQHTEVHWISAFAENMVDANSYKSDDIITTLSGQTVEVINTDAEGRLTLADALTYATLENPDYIVDAATLTGACVMALSPFYTALMGNDKNLADSLQASFEREGDRTVHVPMPEVLREFVTGKISDLINTSYGGVKSGHVTAGLFLSHFVDQNLFRNQNLKISSPKVFNWAHLDIAGSAYNEGQNLLGYNGATGQTVRGLVGWVLSVDQE